MTDMLYYSYEGNFLMNCDAEITQCVVIDDDGTKSNSSNSGDDNKKKTTTVQVALNRTVLHAQGGGQPTDKGTIETSNGTVVEVTKVVLDRSTKIATHTGTVAEEDVENIRVGNTAKVQVSKENRLILSECHTAGHVVDAAMAQCGLLPGMETSKAYHFLDGPYVEYKGNIALEERGPILKKLQTAFQELVEADMETGIQVLDKDKAQQVCDRVQENYFNLSAFGDEPVRLVTVAGWTCPCGGTHVKSTASLRDQKWGVTGLKYKKGVVKIKYNQDWENAK